MKQLTLMVSIALGTVGVLAASTRGVQAAPKALDLERALFVTLVAPARSRHTLPDLADPGLNNVITVRFSTYVNRRDLLDEQDGVSTLSSKCDFRNQALATVFAHAYVRQNTLTVDPFDVMHPVLPLGRYTLTLKSSIRSVRGKLLNDGAGDFKLTFFVGHGTYPPVLRRVSPPAGQTGVGLHRAIVATFDEPIDAASASAAIRLEDRSTSPPTPVPARVTLARNGFDVVVAPGTGFSYPPRADVALVISGRGSATDPSTSVLTETGGQKFTRDRGPQWVADPAVPTLFHSRNGDFHDVTGEFTMTFRTRGAAPAAHR